MLRCMYAASGPGAGDAPRVPPLAQLPIITWPVARQTNTRDRVRWLVDSGRWQRVGHGIFVTHNGPLDWGTRAAIVVLAVTRPSSRAGAVRAPAGGLGEWAAAYVDGLTDRPPATITVVVPHRRMVAVPKDGRLVRSRVQRIDQDVWPPRTTIESTVLHLAASEPADAFLALIGRALQLRLTTMAAPAAELARWGRHPHRAMLAALLSSDADGAESALELRWVRDVERAHGIPPARRQMRQVVAGVGRRYDLDYADGAIRIELDGFLYHDRARALGDRQKGNASALAGRVQLRYGWVEVTADPCAVAADLIHAARTRGVTWEARSCRRSGCRVGSTMLGLSG